MKFLVKNLKVRIYTPQGDKVYTFVEDTFFNAKSRSTLRHVIGRYVLSLFGFKQSCYDRRGTAYLNKDYSITVVEVKFVNAPAKYFRYAHGIYYVKTEQGWTAIPDSDVTEDIIKYCKGVSL